ncbi:MAG: toll/interleukin-1 receptor domain-containing protein, partial [Clostridiales bacterium]|nr:toll/interleukin-1 receptor domain-containing protein [Clostridiales bacterium]
MYFKPTDEGDYCFLSYKKEDIDYLRKIAPHFQFKAWYDFGIDYTEQWQEQIAKHIRESVFVILFLSNAVLVKDSFVMDEFEIAVRHGKKVFTVFLEPIDEKNIPMCADTFY